MQWYLDSGELMDVFRTCCAVVRSLPTGTAQANLKSAEILSGAARDAEIWLLSHPCPQRWNENDLRSIVNVFTVIGAFIVAFDGDVRDADGEFLIRIDDVCKMVERVEKLVGRLNS